MCTECSSLSHPCGPSSLWESSQGLRKNQLLYMNKSYVKRERENFFFRLELTQRRKQGINWCCLPNVRKIPQIIAIPTFMSLPGHHFVQVLITVMRRTLPIHTVVVHYAFFNWVSLWTSASCNFASGDRSSRMGSRLIFAFQAGHISYVWFRTFSALITFALECKVKSLLNH